MNPPFHPKCRVILFDVLILRARALSESGEVTSAAAILVDLATIFAYPNRPEAEAVCGQLIHKAV